jgi:hypothetical protein
MVINLRFLQRLPFPLKFFHFRYFSRN